MEPEFIYFNEITDGRGGLVALEQNRNIPFEIKRVYYIYGTPENVRRGFHAHKALQQVDCRLDSPTTGLLIGAMLWHEMYDFTEDCVLMVLASELYDEVDYIRDYERFTLIVQQ